MKNEVLESRKEEKEGLVKLEAKEILVEVKEPQSYKEALLVEKPDLEEREKTEKPSKRILKVEMGGATEGESVEGSKAATEAVVEEKEHKGQPKVGLEAVVKENEEGVKAAAEAVVVEEERTNGPRKAAENVEGEEATKNHTKVKKRNTREEQTEGFEVVSEKKGFLTDKEVNGEQFRGSKVILESKSNEKIVLNKEAKSIKIQVDKIKAWYETLARNLGPTSR